MKFIKGIRFYIDLPFIVWFLFLILLFHGPLENYVYAPAVTLLNHLSNLSVAQVFFIGVIQNIFSAFIIAFLLYLFFRHTKWHSICGEYNAFDIDANGNEIEYGKITILFYPLSLDRTGTPVKLKLIHQDIQLEGIGRIVDRTLIGFYAETGKPERRRSGSFFYELDGDGRTWQGEYNSVSPTTHQRTLGKAIWRRA